MPFRFIKNKQHELSSKIYMSISSEGYGHSSRALALAREFNNDEILIGTYGYAYDKIKNLNLPSVELKQELKLVGDKGAFNVGKTIVKNHSWALTFNKLVKEEINIIQESGASCVVADGRLVPVMAADKLGLPCVVITNQSKFYPFFAKDSALIRVFGRSFDWIMKTWLSSTEEIMIPDFPPPYTICLSNLSHKYKVRKRTRFVGPLVAWNEDEIPLIDTGSNPNIVVTLGGHAYRRPILDHVLKVAEKMPDVQFKIFTSFETENIPDNVKIIGFVNNIAEHMKSSDLIITQAGHSTAMELLTLGKQSIIIPDFKQVEQENNAQKMAELEVATKIGYNELSEYKLIENINLMLNDTKYINNAKRFKDMAKEIKGRQKAAEILREYSNRLNY